MKKLRDWLYRKLRCDEQSIEERRHAHRMILLASCRGYPLKGNDRGMIEVETLSSRDEEGSAQ